MKYCNCNIPRSTLGYENAFFEAQINNNNDKVKKNNTNSLHFNYSIIRSHLKNNLKPMNA